MEITKQDFKTKCLKVTREIGRLLTELENTFNSLRPNKTSIEYLMKQIHTSLNELELLISKIA